MVAGFVFLSTNKQTCYIGISLHERQPYTGLVSLYRLWNVTYLNADTVFVN